MSLDKSIKSGREHRKHFTGAKSIDHTCRNHGTCSWCKGNRLYQRTKEELRVNPKKVSNEDF